MIEFQHATDRLRFRRARKRNMELARETEASMAWQRRLLGLVEFPQGEADHRKNIIHLDTKRKKP